MASGNVLLFPDSVFPRLKGVEKVNVYRLFKNALLQGVR
jgi:hypothetical protein